MSEQPLLFEQLQQVNEALERVQRRFLSIKSVDDFLDSDHGLDMLDSIAMMLIAVGENFKNLDKRDGGALLAEFPEINWPGVKGIRDVLSHQYFNIDAEVIFNLCTNDLPRLRKVVALMLERCS